METEQLLTSIEQWYKWATNLDRYWRESKKKEERLKRQQEQGGTAPR